MPVTFRSTVPALVLALSLPAAHADGFSTLGLLTQGEFQQLVKDVGAASSYKNLASAAPLGVTGFDIAITGTFASLEARDLWTKASGGESMPSTLPVPGVRIAKGLPLGIDIGASVSAMPDVGGTLAGAELRWAIVDGGTLTPALGLRVSYNRLTGVDQLSLSNTAVDIAVSKGFPIVTPYAGVGVVRTSAKAEGAPALTSESPNQTRLFGGAHFNFGLVDMTFEAERTGDTASLSARLGFRF